MKIKRRLTLCAIAFVLLSSLLCWSQNKRKIIIDQDAAGPAGTDQQSMLLLIQSPQTDVLGITVVTGDMWLTEEVAHTLRMLEIIGRTDIPVLKGAEYPLVRRKDETDLMETTIWICGVAGCVDAANVSRARRTGRDAGRMPTTKPARRRCGAFFDSHGPQVSRRKSRSMKAGL